MIEQAAFLILSAVTLGAAVGVVTARSVFVSALWLVLSFLGVAGLYVLLDAGFLAAIQVLIYVGAISVLLLFAVMLTRNIMAPDVATTNQWAAGLTLALAVFGGLAVVGHQADWRLNRAEVVPPGGGAVVVEAGASAAEVPGVILQTDENGVTTPVATGTIATLGRSFMSDYLLAFEVAGAILLVALLGAIVIARD